MDEADWAISNHKIRGMRLLAHETFETTTKIMTSAVDAPEGVQHYHFLAEVPSNIAKYWQQRNQIFSKYDEGVWLTDDAWFGVTPEPIAK